MFRSVRYHSLSLLALQHRFCLGSAAGTSEVVKSPRSHARFSKLSWRHACWQQSVPKWVRTSPHNSAKCTMQARAQMDFGRAVGLTAPGPFPTRQLLHCGCTITHAVRNNRSIQCTGRGWQAHCHALRSQVMIACTCFSANVVGQGTELKL
jgi:hypothetical protein